jgi:hypothetical protein
MTDSLPTEDALLAAIAHEAGVSEAAVKEVLVAADVSLTRPLPAQRSVLLHRLYVSGVKTGTTAGADGPFERDIMLRPGTWAVASRINSAGKSSMLWALVWALRGDPDETYQRPESKRWFRDIRVDAQVSGVPVSFRIRQDENGFHEGHLLTADSVDQLTALAGMALAGTGVRVVEAVSDQTAFAALVSRFMMDRLALRPLHVFTAQVGAPLEDGGRDGTVQTHQWPSYFSVIGLASGSDSLLFGRTAFGQLPTRYMQVFLDVPFIADVMTAEAAAKESRQASKYAIRRASADADARAERWQPLQEELRQARERLDLIRTARPDLPARISAAQAATRALLPLQTCLARQRATEEDARQLRLQDDRTLRRANESVAARMLFGALDPQACPRCEASIGDDRRRHEADDHRCAVCASPLQVGPAGEDERQEDLDELGRQLAASRAAEQAARAAVRSAEDQLGKAEEEASAAVALAEQEQGQTEYLSQLRAAESEVARLTGAMQVVSQLGEPAPVDDESDRVLSAAKKVLNTLAATATKSLLTELNDEIVSLARRLGVTNLRSVSLDLAGKVNAMKSDNPRPTAFKSLSPGERLRLRIAVVISLIRVGRRHGIHSHPGLLIIDAPVDVEIVPGDVQLLLEQLRALDEEDDLQVLIATAHEAVWKVFPEERIIAGPDGQHLF